METVRYFWHCFIHRGTTYTYLQYSRLPLFNTFCQMFGKRQHFCWCSVWAPYSTHKFISCVVPGLSQWFFHFGEEIVIQQGSKELSAVLFSTWGRPVRRLSWTASLPSRDLFNPSCLCAIWQRCIATCFTQSLQTFLCTMTSCHFNFDPGTLP